MIVYVMESLLLGVEFLILLLIIIDTLRWAFNVFGDEKED